MFHRHLTTPLDLSCVGPKASARVGVRDGLLQLTYLGFQKIVRDDQRTNSRARIAAASGDRLVDAGLQLIVLFVRLRDRRHGAVPGCPSIVYVLILFSWSQAAVSSRPGRWSGKIPSAT